MVEHQVHLTSPLESGVFRQSNHGKLAWVLSGVAHGALQRSPSVHKKLAPFACRPTPETLQWETTWTGTTHVGKVTFFSVCSKAPFKGLNLQTPALVKYKSNHYFSPWKMPWAAKWKQEEPSTQVVHFQLVYHWYPWPRISHLNQSTFSLRISALGNLHGGQTNLDDFHISSYQGTPNEKHTPQLFDPSVLAQGKGFSLQLPGVLQEANQGFEASDRFDDFGEVAGEPQKLWKILVGEGGKSDVFMDQSYIWIYYIIVLMNSHLHLTHSCHSSNKTEQRWYVRTKRKTILSVTSVNTISHGIEAFKLRIRPTVSTQILSNDHIIWHIHLEYHIPEKYIRDGTSRTFMPLFQHIQFQFPL